jgi:MFS superfamily sulfate permease-like transporter
MQQRDDHTWTARINILRHDFMASVVVFLVALPLSMGIAIASGVPVAAGLITGIIGGIVVGFLAGCPLQVSGPAAGLTVIVYEIVQRFGFEMLGLAVLVGGAVQLAAGALRLGQWFRAVSPAVVKGMLSGIGVLIFASQFHVMVDDKPRESGIANLLAIPGAIAKSVAVPDFQHRDVARFRMHALRELGEVHRRQLAVQEFIAETAPHAPGEAPPASAGPVDLSGLAAQQSDVLRELAAVAEPLRDFEGRMHDGERSRQILAASSVATEKCQAALRAIEQGSPADAVRSQDQAVAALEALLGQLKNHHLAAEIGILTIAALLAWSAFAPRRLRVVPAPLVAVTLATVAATLLSIPVLYVEVPDYLWHELHPPSLAVLRDAPWREILQQGLLIAVVASAETLLCAAAVDQLHTGARGKLDRELCAHGVGNMLCGLLGALPMTGVIVRSYANVQAGARSRASAILHGVWLLLFVTGLAFLLRLIPTASLAAILVYTGYKLINFKAVRELWQYGRGEAGIYVVTVVTIVAADLLTGVLVGIALAAGKLLYTFSHLDIRLETKPGRRKATLQLKGAATFIGLPRLAARLSEVPQDAELHVHFDHLDYIDHACLDLLMTWAKQHEANGGKLVLDWDSLHAQARTNRPKRAHSAGAPASSTAILPAEGDAARRGH